MRLAFKVPDENFDRLVDSAARGQFTEYHYKCITSLLEMRDLKVRDGGGLNFQT